MIFIQVEGKMQKVLRLLPLLPAVLLAGCFETSQTFTMNPDGSGKVVMESRFQTLSLAGDKLDKAQLKREILETMEKSEGIDAWRDVSYRIEPDGRIYFKGTGYFKDINTVNLDKGSTVRWTRDGKEWRLELVARKEDEDDEEPSEPKPRKLTDDEISRRIQAERLEWKHSKPLMESMMSTLIMDAVFQLPGKVISVNNLKKNSDTSVSFHLDGAKMVKALDTLINNDAWMKAKAIEGKLESPSEGPPMGEDVNELTFGQKGDVVAHVSGELKSLFDYDAESLAAKTEYRKILAELKAE